MPRRAILVGLGALALLAGWHHLRVARSALLSPRDSRGTLVIGGVTRSYILHVPPSSHRRHPIPLVLVLHGGGGTGLGMERLSHMNEAADRFGFAAVFPDGIKRSWNDGRGVTGAQKRGVDDIGFLIALIDRMERRLPVQRDMVFVAGISNGGFMAQRLACAHPERFAAFASVAAGLPAGPWPACHPSRAIPALYIHGTDDPLVPYTGGSIALGRGSVQSIAASVRFWARLDRCSSAHGAWLPNREDDGTRTHLTWYGRCLGRTSVALYSVHGGGHTWPGGQQYLPALLVGHTSRDFAADTAIWRFFVHPYVSPT